MKCQFTSDDYSCSLEAERYLSHRNEMGRARGYFYCWNHSITAFDLIILREPIKGDAGVKVGPIPQHLRNIE